MFNFQNVTVSMPQFIQRKKKRQNYLAFPEFLPLHQLARAHARASWKALMVLEADAIPLPAMLNAVP